MAATVELRSFHGATTPDTGTAVGGGTITFKQADNDTNDANNPNPIPGSGTNYSFVKNLALYVTVTPANTINNLKVYSDGGNGLGTGVGLVGKTSSTYVDPVANGSTALAGTADMFSHTSGSPLAITGSLSNPSTGKVGDYVVLQMSIGSTASQGNTGTETITFSYDES